MADDKEKRRQIADPPVSPAETPDTPPPASGDHPKGTSGSVADPTELWDNRRDISG